MRVTCVVASLAGGGAERAALTLSGWLADNGVEIDLLTLRADVPDAYPVPTTVTRRHAPRAAGGDVPWWSVPAQVRRARSLRRALLSRNPDVVLAFQDLTNVSTLQALVGARVPVVVSEQIDLRHHHIGRRWSALRRLWYPRAALVAVPSRRVAEHLVAAYPRWRVATAPNPLEPPAGDTHAARPSWFAERNVVAMGRLVHQKGFDQLLHAFAPLAKRHPAWDLTILGDGELREPLTQLVGELELGGRVHLPGFVNPPWSVLAHADIFAFSSRFEGWGNALAEALACGLPAVTFDCPSGPGEIVRDGVDGRVVPENDIGAFSSALGQLMTDEALRTAFADRARDVEQRFGLAAAGARWLELLESVR